MLNNSDAVRRSVTATIDEIRAGEAAFKAEHGINITEPDEWMQLKDIVARIERRLLANMPATEAAE